MRVEPQVNTHPRLLREATLGIESAAKKGKGEAPAGLEEPMAGATEATAAERSVAAPKKPKQKTGSRFLGPVHLDERQKADICRSLKRKGVGDEMGRQIFVAAVEYQLSAFGDQLARGEVPQSKPPPRDRALDQILLAIEEQARVLSELLLQIPRPSIPDLTRAISAQDERDWDEHRLLELGTGIDRLRRACNAMTSVAEVRTEEAGPDSAVGTKLIQKLGAAFGECFEQEPTAAEDGDFRICLEVLNQVADFAIGLDPDLLASALSGKSVRSP